MNQSRFYALLALGLSAPIYANSAFEKAPGIEICTEKLEELAESVTIPETLVVKDEPRRDPQLAKHFDRLRESFRQHHAAATDPRYGDPERLPLEYQIEVDALERALDRGTYKPAEASFALHRLFLRQLFRSELLYKLIARRLQDEGFRGADAVREATRDFNRRPPEARQKFLEDLMMELISLVPGDLDASTPENYVRAGKAAKQMGLTREQLRHFLRNWRLYSGNQFREVYEVLHYLLHDERNHRFHSNVASQVKWFEGWLRPRLTLALGDPFRTLRPTSFLARATPDEDDKSKAGTLAMMRHLRGLSNDALAFFVDMHFDKLNALVLVFARDRLYETGHAPALRDRIQTRLDEYLSLTLDLERINDLHSEMVSAYGTGLSQARLTHDLNASARSLGLPELAPHTENRLEPLFEALTPQARIDDYEQGNAEGFAIADRAARLTNIHRRRVETLSRAVGGFRYTLEAYNAAVKAHQVAETRSVQLLNPPTDFDHKNFSLALHAMIGARGYNERFRELDAALELLGNGTAFGKMFKLSAFELLNAISLGFNHHSGVLIAYDKARKVIVGGGLHEEEIEKMLEMIWTHLHRDTEIKANTQKVREVMDLKAWKSTQSRDERVAQAKADVVKAQGKISEVLEELKTKHQELARAVDEFNAPFPEETTNP